MTLSGAIKDREYQKFTETFSGETAVRVVMEVQGDHDKLQRLDYASAGHTGFEPTVTKGDLVGSSVITVSGGSGAVIGSGVTIDAVTASETSAGVVSSSDFTLFKRAADALEISGDVTGFRYPESTTLTYDPTARTVTVSGDVEAYYQGRRVTELVDGWVSAPHDAGSNSFFLYYNGSSFVWTNTPWSFKDLMIVMAFRDTANFALRECHGLMDWESHREFHQTTGTYLISGGDLSGYTLNSTTATNRRPTIAQTTIADEDLITVNSALSTNAYTWLFLSSAGTANLVADNAEIINLSTNQPYYNEFTGSIWQQTLMTANHYAKIFVMALPTTANEDCQKRRFVFIQPQTTNASLPTIQAVTPSSVNLGHIATALAEYVYIGEIIIRYTAANWVLISVAKLSGTKSYQASAPAGNYLSTVSTSSQFTGDGTAANPLTAATSFNLGAASTLTATRGIFAGDANSSTDNNIKFSATNIAQGIYVSNPDDSVNASMTITMGDNRYIQVTKNGLRASHQVRQNTSTTALPAYSHNSDNNTGLHLATGDILSLVTGGTERVYVGSTGLVGVGNTAPDTQLHITGTSGTNPTLKAQRNIASTTSVNSAMSLLSMSTGNMQDGFGTGVIFTIEDDALVENNIGRISAVRSGADNSGAMNFDVANAGTLTTSLSVSPTGSVILGPQAALATNATSGFAYIPTCAGTPTGVPSAVTGKAAMVFDTANGKLYVYNGAWIAMN